jgi:hypothetical protein
MGRLAQVSPTLSLPCNPDVTVGRNRTATASLERARMKRRLKAEAKRGFIFDHLWGIPGPALSLDYQILR